MQKGMKAVSSVSDALPVTTAQVATPNKKTPKAVDFGFLRTRFFME